MPEDALAIVMPSCVANCDQNHLLVGQERCKSYTKCQRAKIEIDSESEVPKISAPFEPMYICASNVLKANQHKLMEIAVAIIR